MSETQLAVTFLKCPAAVCQSIHQRQPQKGLFKAAGKMEAHQSCRYALMSLSTLKYSFGQEDNSSTELTSGILINENQNNNYDNKLF